MMPTLQSFLWFNFLYAPCRTHLGDMRILKSSDNWTHFNLHLYSKYRCLTCWNCKKQSKSEIIIIWKFIWYTTRVVLVCDLPQCRVQQPWALRKNAWEHLMGRTQQSAKWASFSPLHPFTSFPSYPPFILPLPHSLALLFRCRPERNCGHSCFRVTVKQNLKCLPVH